MTTATRDLLSSQQIAQYQRDGFVVVPDLLSPEEVTEFIEHDRQHRVSITQGLFGHRADPVFKRIAMHPRIAGIARQIAGGEIRIVQTMYMDKAPAGGVGVAMHQDTHYLPNEPNTLFACWVAMTDADVSNGGLCVVPGSHRKGLRKAHANENSRDHAAWTNEYPMRDRDGREWKEKMFSFEIDGLERGDIVALNVPRGAGVYFTSLTIHGSFANTSPDRARKAFAIHYVREGTWCFRQDVQETTPVEIG